MNFSGGEMLMLGWAVSAGVAVLVGVAGVVTVSVVAEPDGSGVEAADGGNFQMTVTKIVDGDTFDASVDNQSMRVRLILVDTPELVGDSGQPECLALDAKEQLEALLPVGSTAFGEYDADPTDPYGRELLYVWNGEQTFINRELVSLGLANIMFVPPNDKRRPEIESAMSSARAAGAGLLNAGIACTPAALTAQAQAAADTAQRDRDAAEAQRLARLEAKRARAQAQERREEQEFDAWMEQQREKSAGESSGGDNSGYTGPRCYAPGGKTWSPC